MDDTTLRAALLEQLVATNAELSVLVGERKRWLRLDITMGQLRALMFVSREQLTFVSDVADTLGISRPAASVMVDRLVQLGMIARHEDQEDRRRTLVTLTSAGRDLVDQLLNGPASMRDSLTRLPLKDLEALAQGMSALVRQLRADAAAASPCGDPIQAGSLSVGARR